MSTNHVRLGANGRVVNALFDSGSNSSFITRELVEKFNLKEKKGIHCVNSFSCDTTVIHSYVFIVTRYHDKTVYVKYWILDSSPFPVILGTEALSQLNVILDFSSAVTDHDMIDPNLDRRQKAQLEKLINSFSDVFSSSDTDIGHCTVLKHDIDVGDARPFKSENYSVPQSIKSEVGSKVQELLKAGIIKPSSSPWSNPIFFVRKKCGSLRLIVDFRKLNSISVTDNFPIPIVEDLFVDLGGCKYFSSLDLTSGYYQVELNETAKEKTAFIANNQLFEFNRLPFGLKNAPALFQRLMQVVLVNTGVLPYLDDVVVASTDFDKHLATLRTVFERFRQYNLKVKPAKCKFGAKELLYLGMLISENGIKPDPKKIESLRNLKTPSCKKDVERLCGFINYLSKFIPRLSDIFEPIFESKTSKPFRWTHDCREALDKIKDILEANVLLKFPDFSSDFFLTTDASSSGLGAVLEQKNGPIAYVSRSLNKAERNYSATDREYLALVWGIKKFRNYLYGRHFICKTDHKPLLSMVKSQPINSRHSRYLQFLEEYNFSLEYIPGRDNVMADLLSRDTTDDTVEPSRGTRDKSQGNVPSYTAVCASEKRNRTQVDDEEIEQVVKRHHEYGHLGALKTKFSILNSNLYFRNMIPRIRKYINECVICAQNKSYSSKCKSGTLPKNEVQPFEVVSIDLVGPLPTSIGGHRYVLTMIDNASRWAEAVALTNIRAETVAESLVRCWIHRFGPPRHFLSDCGTQFLSCVFQELQMRLSFKHKHTTIFHPQGNSIVERLHREIKDRLRCCRISWFKALQDCVWHHNRTEPSDANRPSPFQFLFGRSPGIPIEWPDHSSHFLPFNGKCPRFACPKNFRASGLEPKFFPPIRVRKRLSEQLVLLDDGRTVNIKNSRLIW